MPSAAGTPRADLRSSTPTGAIADDIARPRHRKRRDRHAARQRLEQHQPERVGPAREHEDVRRRHRSRPAPRPAARRGTRRPDKPAPARPAPDRRRRSPWCRADRGSRNASRFFSTATRPTQRNTGRGRHRSTSRGWNSLVSTPRDHSTTLRKAAARAIPPPAPASPPSRRGSRHGTSAASPTPRIPAPARAPRHSRESGCGSSW